MIKKVGSKIFEAFGLLSFYSLKKSGYLHDKGWFNSFKSKRSIDKEGQPIPWMTYAFIDFLTPRIHNSMTVFEYGSGNSSLWWQNKVAFVTSVENNEDWYNEMKKHESDKFKILHRGQDNGQFVKSITENSLQYDIIVIDGVDRVDCAKNCINNLAKTGVIIWDNSDRREYQEGYDFILSLGFKRLDFFGLGPINVMAWSTSVFYRTNNCLNI